MSTIFAIRGIQPHLFKRSQAMRSINGQLTKRINDLPCSSHPCNWKAAAARDRAA